MAFINKRDTDGTKAALSVGELGVDNRTGNSEIGRIYVGTLDGNKASALQSELVGTSIANTPAGNIAATNVQAAINELDTEKANLASPSFTGTPDATTGMKISGVQASPYSFKNLLINALGTINQRGYVSGTATTSSNQYTLDRWRVVTSGQNLTFSTSANVVTFTAPAGGIEQVIEGSSIQSGTHVVSWTGAATCTVNGVAKASGGTFTLTGGSNATVRFIGGTFSKPQIEKGSIATSFEEKPIGLEKLLCQRYCRSISAGRVGGVNNGSKVPIVTNELFRDMRTVPSSVIFYGGNTSGGNYSVNTMNSGTQATDSVSGGSIGSGGAINLGTLTNGLAGNSFWVDLGEAANRLKLIAEAEL